MPEQYPVLPGCEPFSAPGHGARAGVGFVISHGITGNPTSTRPLGEALAAKGFAVEVVRLPGHGTAWQDMARTRYPDWRAEVERAIDRLRQAGKQVIVAGLSLGATITYDLAATRGDALLGAVAINGQVLDREGLVARLAPVLARIIPVVPGAAAGLVKNDIARGGDERAYAMVPTKAGNSALPELRRIREGLSRVRIPMLVAYSRNDHSVSPENSRAAFRLLGSADKTELVLERSYHIATMDHDAELLTETIVGFADRIAAAHSKLSQVL